METISGVRNTLLVPAVIIVAILELISAHGTVLDPIARQSRWRNDKSAAVNYDDVGMFCGGFYVQWELNNGQCGLCGDNFAHPTPRAHELGGKYGQGVIVKSYPSGGPLQVKVSITANHEGNFWFKLCNLDNNNGKENEACFDKTPLKLANNQDFYKLESTLTGNYYVTLQLPKGMKCKRCVLQWTYVTGNSWGTCKNGSGAMGCGAQEHFRACSDISIY